MSPLTRLRRLPRRLAGLLGAAREGAAGTAGPGGPHARAAHGQHGEDLVLWGLLGADAAAPGFYVDVGAHDPAKYSNTKLFYDAGWRGLNVDPRPGMKAAFDAARPRDVNVEGRRRGRGPARGRCTCSRSRP